MSPRCRVSARSQRAERSSRMAEQQAKDGPRRVRVWFGTHAIEDHVAQPDPASNYEAAMRRRFAGLLVTNEPASMPRRTTVCAP